MIKLIYLLKTYKKMTEIDPKYKEAQIKVQKNLPHGYCTKLAKELVAEGKYGSLGYAIGRINEIKNGHKKDVMVMTRLLEITNNFIEKLS